MTLIDNFDAVKAVLSLATNIKVSEVFVAAVAYDWEADMMKTLLSRCPVPISATIIMNAAKNRSKCAPELVKLLLSENLSVEGAQSIIEATAIEAEIGVMQQM